MYKFSFKLSLFLVVLLICVPHNEGFFRDYSLPCDYLDSINISTGMIHANKSIIFNGNEFAEGQYAKVNYIWKDEKLVKVDPYYRGCPCIEKSCIRFCCPYGSFVVGNSPSHGFKCQNDEAARKIESEIIKENNDIEVISLSQQFGILDRICSNHYYAEDFQINHVTEILFF